MTEVEIVARVARRCKWTIEEKAALLAEVEAEGGKVKPDLARRIWQATFSIAGGTQTGRAGDGLMLSRTQPRPPDAPHATLAEIQSPIIDTYLGALPTGTAPRVLGSRSVFVADTRTEALRLANIGLRTQAARFVEQGYRLPGDTLHGLVRTFDVRVGSPTEVVASLRADSTLERVTDLAVQPHSVDPPHSMILRSIELVAQEVAPALGWRSVPAAERSLAAAEPAA
ncbi:MAG: hypothetical protein ACJ8AW_45345 [Rhodopila sp.]